MCRQRTESVANFTSTISAQWKSSELLATQPKVHIGTLKVKQYNNQMQHIKQYNNQTQHIKQYNNQTQCIKQYNNQMQHIKQQNNHTQHIKQQNKHTFTQLTW